MNTVHVRPLLCLFDLDGTLIDSEEGIFAGIRHALGRLEIPVPAENVLRQWIGPPLRHNFASVLDADRVEDGVSLYREYFEATGWREHSVYADIPELLASLKADGHTLVVVTSKIDVHAHRIIEALPFGHLFSATYAAKPDSMHSEKASMIAAALADFAVAADAAVMIGDRHFDIDGARANGVRGIGVLWGFGDADELRNAGASAIVRTALELRQALGG
ncbi:MAG TPA: HAD hydrolase-like protein [Luteibacter sp.]|nr:HAD hydrolase-like protein [Luteibacter sp.]